jgi:Rieske Fe-S protein
VARLDALAPGSVTRVEVRAAVRDGWMRSPPRRIGAAWLLRSGDLVRAWSAVCPHLGCAVDHAGNGGFVCPCHDSAFGPDGRRRSGPSPRDMDPLDVEVRAGTVLIRFVRYRRGVARREAIG